MLIKLGHYVPKHVEWVVCLLAFWLVNKEAPSQVPERWQDVTPIITPF